LLLVVAEVALHGQAVVALVVLELQQVFLFQLAQHSRLL
jgi:hypothetical protein